MRTGLFLSKIRKKIITSFNFTSAQQCKTPQKWGWQIKRDYIEAGSCQVVKYLLNSFEALIPSIAKNIKTSSAYNYATY